MTTKQLEAITRHGEQLNAIFHTGLAPVTLCKKLRRIESAAHKLAEDACNFMSMESAAFNIADQSIKYRLTVVLENELPILYKMGVFINLDPRGYALKIDSDYMTTHNIKLYTDFGGYGILAPEFNKEGR